MTDVKLAPLTTWLTGPLDPKVMQSVNRLRMSEDVRRIALMPDVHLAEGVCIGAVVATERLIYPAAVGADIGCGIVSIAFEAEASLIDSDRTAGKILAGLYECVPVNKHVKPRELPGSLSKLLLSDARLQKSAARDGKVQLGTLGRGNHFLEFLADHDNRLWTVIHSGSRAMGQLVTHHHLGRATSSDKGLHYLDVESEPGEQYLADVHWARAYAAENRLAMLTAVVQLVQRLFGVAPEWDTLIHCDHNHVQRERHGEQWWRLHRKGAQSATNDEPGIIPGSMGTATFHTLGRGCAEALHSSSHGAGRALSRSEARQTVSQREFARQVGKLWYDHRCAAKLREEAPSAYKDIRHVMKAQRDLTRIVRELRPILTYKGV
jgi:tRNA-splicing ligase RtcB